MSGYTVKPPTGDTNEQTQFIDYFNLFYSKRGQEQISISQQLGNYGTTFFSASRQKYNNIIFLGLCLGLTTYSALSADSVIKISGRVLDYGCTVSSDSLNFTVDLQKNSARQFPTTGSTSPAVPFQITLSECSKGTTGVRVAFNGIEDAENNTLLKLDEGSNTASGLGIEILDANMRPVKLNDLHAGMQWIPLVPEQNNILPYSARLKSTQKSVNPGLVRASATFTLEFQ